MLAPWVRLNKTIQWQGHLIHVIVNQLEAIRVVPLQLPNPSDPQSAARCQGTVLDDPSDRRTLARLSAKRRATSKRTVERLFQDDIGMTFGKWRQQLRLMQAMRLLAEGAKVTHAALESGYSTPSAFISMFRKALGNDTNLIFQERMKGTSRPSPCYCAITFSISSRSSAYGTAPGWYQATFPARSSSTSVGVVDAPYISKLYLLTGTGMSSSPE